MITLVIDELRYRYEMPVNNLWLLEFGVVGTRAQLPPVLSLVVPVVEPPLFFICTLPLGKGIALFAQMPVNGRIGRREDALRFGRGTRSTKAIVD